MELQSDSTTLMDCRVLFNVVSEKYPSMEDTLGDKTSKVLNSHFEKAIRKTQRKEKRKLEGMQQRATHHFKQNQFCCHTNDVVHPDVICKDSAHAVKEFY